MTHSGSEHGTAAAAPYRDDDAESVSRGIANDLKLTRLSKEIALRDVANTLRIQTVYLEALEEGRFAELPGSTYVAGFLRTYGDFLGLDGEELVRRYKEESGGVLAHKELSFPIPASEARQPTAAIVVGALVVAIAGAAVWYILKERGVVDLELVPDVPEEMAVPAPEDPPSAIDAAPLEDPPTPDEPVEAATVEADIAALDAAASDAGSEVAADVEIAAASLGETSETGDAGIAADPAVADGDAAADTAVPTDEMADEGVADAAASTGGTAEDDATDAAVAPAVADTAVPTDEMADEGVADAAASTGGTAGDDATEAAVDPAVADTAVPTGEAVGDGATDETAEVAALEPSEDVEDTDPFAETEALLNTGNGYAPRIYGRANTDSRVEIRAVEETWIQVEVGDDTILLTRVLLPDDIYRVPNRDDVSLDTGNAGGLEIRVDGEKIAPLGESGAVVRDVSLAAEALRSR